MYVYWKQVYDNFETFDATSSPSLFFSQSRSSLRIANRLSSLYSTERRKHQASLEMCLAPTCMAEPFPRVRRGVGCGVLLDQHGLLVLDLACWTLWCCCNSDRRRGGDEPLFCAINFLILMLGCASRATHEFTNDCLDVAATAWDEKDEEGVLKVQCALEEWVQKSFQRLLAKEVASRKKRLATSRSGCATPV